MTLRLNSTGGGFVEIDAPNTASNFSVTMPATAGEIVVANTSGDVDLGGLTVSGSAADDSVNIDSSGRLLVGTASTSAESTQILQGNSADSTFASVLGLARGSAPGSDGSPLGVVRFSDSGHVSAAEFLAARDGGTWTPGSSQPSRLVFNTTADGASTPTERMRIDSAGDVGINVTNPTSRLHVNGTVTVNNIGSGAGTNTLKYSTATGRITYDSSSARYKNNIRNADKGLSEILQLLPRKFEYKDSGRTDFGFIAEEVVQIIPELVTLDSEGLPEAVNYDRFVSVLTAALQEAIVKIETLEAKVAALEAG